MSTIPPSEIILLEILNSLEGGNPTTKAKIQIIFEKMELRDRQIYLTNLRKLIGQQPILNLRTNEKSYNETAVILKDLLGKGDFNKKESE
jgi:hypothetical protein